ncbi:HD domain-containing protein [Thermoplasmatales archaeon AK]|nr:HD domain-containing protein [Thermoplasmatales archaeon AK]
MEKYSFKIIQDPLNGPLKVRSDVLEIIDLPELQRLRYIRQLGMCHLVFPGANHSRFEHAIGTFHIAMQFAEALGVEPKLSHAIEGFFKSSTGMDHLEAGIRMILGEGPFSKSSIPSALEHIGVYPKDIAAILRGNYRTKVVSRLISGPIDVDELDYLRRDSHYTGVSIGNIDYRRIMNVTAIESDNIVIKEKGLSTLESILIARILMYRGVYFHKTVRIAQTMAEYALKEMDKEILNPFSQTDFDLFYMLSNGKSDIGRLLMRRQLFKPVLRVPYSDEAYSAVVEKLDSIKHLDQRDYIVDVIPPLDFSGPERTKSDMLVLYGDELSQAVEVSPLLRALQETMARRTLIVSAHPEKAAEVTEGLRN